MDAVPGGLAAHLAWVDPWLLPVSPDWVLPISWLEAVAAVLSVIMVMLNLKVNPLGWPFAILSSALYGLLFARSKLYGEAALQLVFIAMSAWGWWQWVVGIEGPGRALSVRQHGLSGRWVVLATWLLLWPAIGLLLDRATDSDVPYWDALPTAGSLVAQWLLARKWVENWPCWLAVNLISVALFAHKGLWLTAWLYGLFAALSVAGWLAWQRRAAEAGT